MKSEVKWKTILAMVTVYLAVIMDWQWLWGIFLIGWIIMDLVRGSTYFVEYISKDENPILYWFILFSWFWMAVFIFVIEFYPMLLSY